MKELKNRAINSLILAIELFNRPHEGARAEATLILFHHAFEMLLKAIILNKTGLIHAKDEKFSYGFDKCLAIAENDLHIISKTDKITLSILDTNRDIVTHYFQIISEEMLFIISQASVTLFGNLLNSTFDEKLSDLMPDRVLPISTNPPKDIQILLDREFSQVDSLIKDNCRKGCQATARLRSIVSLLSANEEKSGRYSEKDLLRAIQSRKSGKDWSIIFPEIAQLRIQTTGEGMTFNIRIKKDGDIPVRIAQEGEEAVIYRDRDWFDKYNLGLKEIAKKLGKTEPKTRAYMFEINLWDDPEMYDEKKVKSITFKRYTQKALNALQDIVTKKTEVDIWEKNKMLVLGRRK